MKYSVLFVCVVLSRNLHLTFYRHSVYFTTLFLFHLLDDVDRIIDYVIKGKGRHQFYDKLAIYSDDLGPRYAGSAALEEAIGM